MNIILLKIQYQGKILFVPKSYRHEFNGSDFIHLKPNDERIYAFSTIIELENFLSQSSLGYPIYVGMEKNNIDEIIFWIHNKTKSISIKNLDGLLCSIEDFLSDISDPIGFYLFDHDIPIIIKKVFIDDKLVGWSKSNLELINEISTTEAKEHFRNLVRYFQTLLTVM